MRKITGLATKAFYNGDDFKLSNTEIIALQDVVGMLLHGNIIAEKIGNSLVKISDRGYKTNKTKERLNGILGSCGRITQRKGIWYLKINGQDEQVWTGEYTGYYFGRGRREKGWKKSLF